MTSVEPATAVKSDVSASDLSAESSAESLTDSVFRAVRELCREHAYAEFDVADIVARAGVDEESVRERWPAKNLLVMEALLHVVAPHMRFPRTGDIRADLQQQLVATASLFADPTLGPHLAALLGEVHSDERLAAAFLSKVFGPNRSVSRARFELAKEEGQLRADADVDAAIDMVFGPLWFRLLLGTGPITPELAAAITDNALRGLGVGDAAGPHSDEAQA
jgi:AcrR family transcriptional regulator